MNIYYNGDEMKVNHALQLIKSVSKQSHGTMVIISSNAKDEVDRLSKNNRAIKIEPINLIEYTENCQNQGFDSIEQYCERQIPPKKRILPPALYIKKFIMYISIQ